MALSSICANCSLMLAPDINACPQCGESLKSDRPATGNATTSGAASPGFALHLLRLCETPQTKTLLLVGLGSLGALALSSFLPWFALGPFTVLGVTVGVGLLQLVFSLAAIGVVVTAVARNDARLFDISLYSAAGWSVVAALWRLVNVLQVAGYGVAGMGLIFALLAALAAAATLGGLALTKRRRA